LRYRGSRLQDIPWLGQSTGPESGRLHLDRPRDQHPDLRSDRCRQKLSGLRSGCLEGYSDLYLRLPRLFEELRLAKADGRYGKLMLSYAKTDLLILDD